MIVGHDRNINYYKIQYATLCIRENPGCQFIATNLDAVTHLTGGSPYPLSLVFTGGSPRSYLHAGGAASGCLALSTG